MYVFWEERVTLPLIIWMDVDEPFWGPQTSWKSSVGAQEKSEGACSPSTTNTTLKRSLASTILSTSTLMVL